MEHLDLDLYLAFLDVKNKHPFEFDKQFRASEIQAEGGGATALPVPASSSSSTPVLNVGLPSYKFQQPALSKKIPNDPPMKKARSIDDVLSLRMVYFDMQPLLVVEDKTRVSS